MELGLVHPLAKGRRRLTPLALQDGPLLGPIFLVTPFSPQIRRAAAPPRRDPAGGPTDWTTNRAERGECSGASATSCVRLLAQQSRCTFGSTFTEWNKMGDPVAVLTLSETEYLDDSTGDDELEWTVPCARPSIPVAFVAKDDGVGGGQRIVAIGRVSAKSDQLWETPKTSVPFWFCTNVRWLDIALSQADLSPEDAKVLGALGGFANYRLQGRGAGVRSPIAWNHLLGLMQKKNPGVDLGSFRA